MIMEDVSSLWQFLRKIVLFMLVELMAGFIFGILNFDIFLLSKIIGIWGFGVLGSNM
jgi:hypothetical protein